MGPGTRHAACLTGLAIAAVVALSGCGDEGSSEASDSAAATWAIGSWHGELRQPGLKPFEVWATVRSLQRGSENSVRYSGLDCRGTWAPLDDEGQAARFRERITAGRSETCRGVGIVTLGRKDDDRLAYAFRGGGVESRGVLVREAEGAEQDAPEAERDALAQSAEVQGAPDRDLVLSRVVVPPGAQLALHHHLGTQVAHIEAGVLTYTVRRGSVVVSRGQSDDDPSVVRTIRAGQTAPIEAGEWIVEQPSDIHQAANNGTKPVVIYLATLLEAGAPPATPVEPSD